MSRTKKKMVVKLEIGPTSRRHYNYQGGKTTFDNRPKRLRTRATRNRDWQREYGY